MLITRGAGDPERIRSAVSILRPSPLDEVADAVAAYGSSGGIAAYVERIGDLYRWSPATQGGAYSLLRNVARFVECHHTDLTIGFTTVEGWSIVDPDTGVPRSEQHVVLDGQPTDASEIARAVSERLGDR